MGPRGTLRRRTIVVAFFAVLGMAAIPAAPAAASPFFGTLTSVSCASVGNCTAVGNSKVTSWTGSYASVSRGMAAVSQASGAWGSVAVPPLPADGQGTNYSVLDSVACPGAGDCDATGSYLTNASIADSRALFEGERGGSWSQAAGESVPAPANGNDNVGTTKVACGGVGNCAAIVNYVQPGPSASTSSLLGTESAGTWGALSAPSLPAGARNPNLEDLSCGGPGECVAVGEDTSTFPGGVGLLFSESGGTWGAGTMPPLPADAGSNYVYIHAVSCPAPGSCTAVGTYYGATGTQPLLLDETGGSWRASTAALPADSNPSSPGGDPVAVSCAAPGDCTAVGVYNLAQDEAPLLLTETNGSWGQGVSAGPTIRSTSVANSFIHVSCAAPGSCAASFYSFVLDQSGGSWGQAVTPTPPAGGSYPTIDAISCPAAGDCTAVGSFSPSGSSDVEGLVVSESGGTWGQGASPTIADSSGGAGGTGSGAGSSGGVPSPTGSPAVSGTAKPGGTLTCSAGSWSGSPTSFAYQWYRDGTPIQGANSNTYTVQRSDEGLSIGCAVRATNGVGTSGAASSAPVAVAVQNVKGCPAATGALQGRTLGRVHLGMTRAAARRAFRTSSDRGKKFQDFFCLTPTGIRVGYASRKESAKLAGRVIWASTSSAFYALHGIRVGATLGAASAALRLSAPVKSGSNTWYFTANAASNAVLKVQNGVIEEIGIAQKSLTATAKAQRSFLRSFT